MFRRTGYGRRFVRENVDKVDQAGDFENFQIMVA
jgi:hypothetical protein